MTKLNVNDQILINLFISVARAKQGFVYQCKEVFKNKKVCGCMLTSLT